MTGPMRPVLLTAIALAIPLSSPLTLAACAAEVTADVNPCTEDSKCPEGLRCDGGGACVLADDGCQTDLECADGASCVDGACVSTQQGPTLCGSTAECPVTHACAAGVCTPLGPDQCRVGGQCPSDRPLCDAPSANDVGLCVGPTAPACPEHASAVEGGGACRCDDGYVATDDGAACVPTRATDPPQDPPADQPPPADEPPVAEPPAQQPPPQQPPPDQPPPDDAPADCPPNSSNDPEDPSWCVCDPYYVPDASGTQCVDECEELGWYGDGFFCDFCAWPDPDCF